MPMTWKFRGLVTTRLFIEAVSAHVVLTTKVPAIRFIHLRQRLPPGTDWRDLLARTIRALIDKDNGRAELGVTLLSASIFSEIEPGDEIRFSLEEDGDITGTLMRDDGQCIQKQVGHYGSWDNQITRTSRYPPATSPPAKDTVVAPARHMSSLIRLIPLGVWIAIFLSTFLIFFPAADMNWNKYRFWSSFASSSIAGLFYWIAAFGGFLGAATLAAFAGEEIKRKRFGVVVGIVVFIASYLIISLGTYTMGRAMVGREMDRFADYWHRD